MSDENKVNNVSFTVPCRTSYANIVEPVAYKEGGVAKGEPRYSATFIIDPKASAPNFEGAAEKQAAALRNLQEEVVKILKAKHPGKKFVMRPLTMEELNAGNAMTVQVPWSSGDKQADKLKAAGKDGEVFRGCTLIKASSNADHPPQRSAIIDKKLVEFVEVAAIAQSKRYFYSGAWMFPSFGLSYYPPKGDKAPGVSLYFNGVLFWADGPKLGGSKPSAAEMFKGVVGSISSEDPTGGAHDSLDDELVL